MELSSLTASVTLFATAVSFGTKIKTVLWTHIKELGFFFFLRIAVEVSSSCKLLSVLLSPWLSSPLPELFKLTSCCSAPEGSLDNQLAALNMVKGDSRDTYVRLTFLGAGSSADILKDGEM